MPHSALFDRAAHRTTRSATGKGALLFFDGMSVACVHTETLDGRLLQVFERTGLISASPPAYGVIEMYYQWDTPPDWPKVRIRGRRYLSWVTYRLGHRPGLHLEDDAFNAAFRVDAEDEDFAIAVLSPDMQRFLLTKRSVDWSLGHGAIKLFYRGRFRKKRMPGSVARLREFWSLLPDELREHVGA